MADNITWYVPKYTAITSKRRHKVYYVKYGETIHHISYRFFGTPFRWREIADFNDIDNPFDLPEVIKIPVSEEI